MTKSSGVGPWLDITLSDDKVSRLSGCRDSSKRLELKLERPHERHIQSRGIQYPLTNWQIKGKYAQIRVIKTNKAKYR